MKNDGDKAVIFNEFLLKARRASYLPKWVSLPWADWPVLPIL